MTVVTFFDACCKRNETLDRCRKAPDMLLSDFIGLQEEKTNRNRIIPALISPEDFFERTADEAVRLTGEADAAEAAEAFRTCAVQTADHHGGLFFSQGFQGDLLYAALLGKLGYQGRYVPILCCGQVELENASFARGFMTVQSPNEKQLFPVFPAKNSVQMACKAEPVGQELTGRFRKRFLGKDSGLPSELKTTLDRTLKLMYEDDRGQIMEDPERPGAGYSFSEQITGSGVRLSKELFSGQGPVFLYLEMEGLVTPLLIRELKEGKSLFARLISEDVLRNLLITEKLSDGSCLADVLFRGADEKGRKINLTLLKNGKLSGVNWRKEPVVYDADSETLIRLLNERKIFPGVLAMVCLIFFERSITWFGGIFQSSYLPEWQECFVKILRKAGEEELAQHISSYDCTGYLSGPVFALYRGDGFATPAGPVEFLQAKPDSAKLMDLLNRTRLSEAHLMGLTDMYFDLYVRDERTEDWYRLISEELYKRFPENGVSL